MSANNLQDKLNTRKEQTEQILSQLHDVFTSKATSHIVQSTKNIDQTPFMSNVGMKMCRGYVKDNTGNYSSQFDSRYLQLRQPRVSYRSAITLHGDNVDLDDSGMTWRGESFVTTYHNVTVLNQYALILDNFLNTTTVKHLIYDNDTRDVEIDIYTNEFYEDNGDIFNQGATLYENYRTCSIKVTINRKRERACIFKLYIARNEDWSLKIIYTDVLRKVGLNKLYTDHVGSTCAPLTELMSNKMYNIELNKMFSRITQPKSREENKFFSNDTNERMRTTQLFF